MISITRTRVDENIADKGVAIPFSRSQRIRFKQKSYLLGVGVFLFDANFYALSIAGTIAAPHLRQRIACSILAGFWTSGLLIAGHDACHQSLTPSRRLNRLLATLAFLPALHAYGLWKYGHNHLHHLFTNQRGKDYAWEPLSPRQYHSLGWWSRWRYRFFRTFIGHFFYYVSEIWWQRYFFPRRQFVAPMKAGYWLDFLAVVAWLVTISISAVALRSLVAEHSAADLWNWVEPLMLTVAVPFFVSEMLLSSSTFLHHCHPSVHWYSGATAGEWSDRQIRTSVHVRFPRVVDWLMNWIMDHTAHHAQPAIPSYHLKEAQRSIELQHRDEVVTYRWSLRAMFRILRECKLYDDEAGCWTDYSGHPTSESRRQSESTSGHMPEPGTDVSRREVA